MKQIILIVLLTASIHSIPSWVPGKHKSAYLTMEKAARKMASILRAKSIISECHVNNHKLIFSMKRGSLTTVMEIKAKGIEYCNVIKKKIELEFSQTKATFGQCLSKTGLGFGVGFVIGAGSCLLIKK